MNTSDIIVLLMPVIFAVAWWLFSWIEQRLPEKQRAAFKDFVDIAVKNVEQEIDNMPSSQKKEAAIRIVEPLFEAFKLPVPDAAVISAAIEAAVFEMNQMKIPGLGVNTGPIKTVLPPEGGQPA